MPGTMACTHAGAPRERDAACALRRLIEVRRRERVTLRDLGRTLGLSPFQTLRLFRRQYGITPHQYLVQLRVDDAARLLRGGEPIAEVAVTVGFADQSHMAKHFKRLLGVTPSRYRAGGADARMVA